MSEKAADNNPTKENNTTPNEVKDEWMIRKCLIYDEEYKDCVSIKARFNQLFIFGKTSDCTTWKHDSNNCHKWVEENDHKAANELVESEKLRRKERLTAHYKNDVWTKRKSPPENWNGPLPEHLLKEYENSYLHLKSKEMRGEIPPAIDTQFSNLCNIL